MSWDRNAKFGLILRSEGRAFIVRSKKKGIPDLLQLFWPEVNAYVKQDELPTVITEDVEIKLILETENGKTFDVTFSLPLLKKYAIANADSIKSMIDTSKPPVGTFKQRFLSVAEEI
ncbi:hypothetical protein OAF54_01205 [bacterium]|nr:hypothetical protein [bacterium]